MAPSDSSAFCLLTSSLQKNFQEETSADVEPAGEPSPKSDDDLASDSLAIRMTFEAENWNRMFGNALQQTDCFEYGNLSKGVSY